MSADGNREKAAKALQISLRSLNRHIKDLNLYPFIDKMGWIKQKGPPRGAKGGSVVRMRIIAHIRVNKGAVDYGALTQEIYGADGRTERQRIYTALDQMKNQGQIQIRDDRWVLVEDLTKSPM